MVSAVVGTCRSEWVVNQTARGPERIAGTVLSVRKLAECEDCRFLGKESRFLAERRRTLRRADYGPQFTHLGVQRTDLLPYLGKTSSRFAWV